MDGDNLLEIKKWKVLIKCHWRDRPADTVGFKRMEKRHNAIFHRTFDGDDSLFNDIRRNCMRKADTTDNWMFVYSDHRDILDDYQMLSFFSCDFYDFGIRSHGVYGLMQAMISIVDGIYHIFDMFPGEILFDWIEVSFAPMDHRGYYNFKGRYALESILFNRRK